MGGGEAGVGHACAFAAAEDVHAGDVHVVVDDPDLGVVQEAVEGGLFGGVSEIGEQVWEFAQSALFEYLWWWVGVCGVRVSMGTQTFLILAAVAMPISVFSSLGSKSNRAEYRRSVSSNRVMGHDL